MVNTFERNRFYESQRTLTVGKRAVRYVVMGPDRGEVADETALLVPGIVTRLRGMSLLAEELRHMGYQTVSMAHDYIDEDCPQDVRAMVEAIRDGEITHDGTKPLTVITHSLGTIHAMRGIASMCNASKYVDGVVVTAPTGYGGVHPEQMVWSLLREAIQRPATEHARDVVIEAFEYTIRARYNLVNKIREARDKWVIDETQQLREAGIPITAVRYAHDMLVHFDEVAAGLGRAGVQYSFDVYADHAGHNSHLLHPGLVATAVTNAIMSQADSEYVGRGATLLGTNNA